MHSFMITVKPAFSATAAAFSLMIPSCIQTTQGFPCFSRSLTACSTMGGTSSGRLKMSTMSICFWISVGMSRRLLWLLSPNTLPTNGFTGTMRYPCSFRYAATRWLSFSGSLERPTTAIVLLSVRIFLISLRRSC